MKLILSHTCDDLCGEIKITGSKSESNRLLILQALYPQISLENISNSDDSAVLKKALGITTGIADIHHAGTAMRFLTGFYTAKPGVEVVLTGSSRMKERPIGLLVEALRSLGAQIEYIEKEGYPPLKITGKVLKESSVSVKANISSQYISALMLMAPSLPYGLEIQLEGPVTSEPYILMTLDLLRSLGIKGKLTGKTIQIEAAEKIAPVTIQVESDWSSASYFFSLAAISSSADIELSTFKKQSLQGDSFIVEIYKQLGVVTSFIKNTIILEKRPGTKPRKVIQNLQNAPDIAQTIAVTCLALGIECELSGLHTLKIKETDRLVALKTEMEKFGASVSITNDSLKLIPPQTLNENVCVSTYNDHRMAMAFAPLSLKVPLEIEDAGVVSKSYPEFWDDMEKLGISVVKASQ
ncbi:3-phosphoshikimate 1-carboxyvinyltransferase [soil metagenome]